MGFKRLLFVLVTFTSYFPVVLLMTMTPFHVKEKVESPWNYSWVVPNQLAATSCPCTIENLRFLKQEGIKHLITLSPDYIPPIQNYSGIDWTYIPIEEFEPPTLEDIKRFINVCKTSLDRKEAVAIHCRAGRGRTGVMAACYLVHFLEMSPEMAISKIRIMRPGSVETYEQEKAVVMYRDYLRQNMD